MSRYSKRIIGALLSPYIRAMITNSHMYSSGFKVFCRGDAFDALKESWNICLGKCAALTGSPLKGY